MLNANPMIFNQTLVTLPTTNSDGSLYYIKPRGLFTNRIKLHPVAYKAILQASEKIRILSEGHYVLVVTRGYVHWDLFKRLKGWMGKIIFSSLFPKERSQTSSIFCSNGHDDGLSVDVTLYNVEHKKFLQFLPWHNVFISKETAGGLLNIHSQAISLLNDVMEFAGFSCHDDIREKLQMHFRFQMDAI